MFSEVLKALRKEKGITQEQLASMIGVDRSSVGKYESTSVIPSIDVLRAIADTFDISLDYLLGRQDAPSLPKSTGGVWVPVLGRVAAGMPIEAIEDIIDYEEITMDTAKKGEHFGLQIKGDSMEPRIKTGDVVIIHRQPDVESGQLAVVMVNGNEATVKKITKQDNGIMLVAFNPSYQPRFYSNEDIAALPVTIIGRVVELRAKF